MTEKWAGINTDRELKQYYCTEQAPGETLCLCNLNKLCYETDKLKTMLRHECVFDKFGIVCYCPKCSIKI